MEMSENEITAENAMISEEEMIYVIESVSNHYQMKYERDPFNYFLTGHCYILADVLKSVFPDGCIMCNKGHVVFRLNDKNYDVRCICSPNDQKMLSYMDNGEYREFTDAFNSELIPDNKEESEEVTQYLTEVGMQARENYENKYLNGSTYLDESTSSKHM